MTLIELGTWFHELEKIIVDLHISLNNAKRLTVHKYDGEEKITNHGFFRHHEYQLRFIMIVQLAKLFANSKQQHYNFHMLLKEVEEKLVKEEIETLLDKNKDVPFAQVFRNEADMQDAIMELRTKMQDLEPDIKKIKTRRDKVYAHKDKGERITILKVEELEPLVLFSAEIYNRLRGGLFNQRMDFNKTGDWEINDVIRHISVLRKATSE